MPGAASMPLAAGMFGVMASFNIAVAQTVSSVSCAGPACESTLRRRCRQSLTANLDALLASYNARAFEYQSPDEWRLTMVFFGRR